MRIYSSNNFKILLKENGLLDQLLENKKSGPKCLIDNYNEALNNLRKLSILANSWNDKQLKIKAQFPSSNSSMPVDLLRLAIKCSELYARLFDQLKDKKHLMENLEKGFRMFPRATFIAELENISRIKFMAKDGITSDFVELSNQTLERLKMSIIEMGEHGLNPEFHHFNLKSFIKQLYHYLRLHDKQLHKSESGLDFWKEHSMLCKIHDMLNRLSEQDKTLSIWKGFLDCRVLCEQLIQACTSLMEKDFLSLQTPVISTPIKEDKEDKFIQQLMLCLDKRDQLTASPIGKELYTKHFTDNKEEFCLEDIVETLSLIVTMKPSIGDFFKLEEVIKRMKVIEIYSIDHSSLEVFLNFQTMQNACVMLVGEIRSHLTELFPFFTNEKRSSEEVVKILQENLDLLRSSKLGKIALNRPIKVGDVMISLEELLNKFLRYHKPSPESEVKKLHKLIAHLVKRSDQFVAIEDPESNEIRQLIRESLEGCQLIIKLASNPIKIEEESKTYVQLAQARAEILNKMQQSQEELEIVMAEILSIKNEGEDLLKMFMPLPQERKCSSNRIPTLEEWLNEWINFDPNGFVFNEPFYNGTLELNSYLRDLKENKKEIFGNLWERMDKALGQCQEISRYLVALSHFSVPPLP